jgi:hypothetical protein
VIPLSLLLVLTSLGLLVAGMAKDSQPLMWASLLASLGACGCLVISVLSRRATVTGTAGPPAGQPIDLGSPAPDPALPMPPSSASPWAAPPLDAPPLDARPLDAAPLDARPRDAAPLDVPPTDAPPTASAPAYDTAPASPFRPPADVDAVPSQRTDVEQWPTGAPADPAAPDRTRSVAPSDDPGAAAPPAPADEPAIEDIPVADALRVAQLSDEVLVVDGRPRYHLAGCRVLADRATVPLPVSAARRGGFTPCAVCHPDSTLLARSRSTARPPG